MYNFELLLNDKEKASVLKPSEFKRLKREATYGRNGLRNLAIVWFSFSGLRVTEIAHLKVKDILEKNGDLREQYRLPSSYTKNSESRWAYILDDEHRTAVNNYLNWRKEKRLRLGLNNQYLGLSGDSPLFLSRGESGFTFIEKEYKKADDTIEYYSVCSSLQQLLSKLYKTTGVLGASTHSGRRTFGTRLAERGVDLDLIRYLLGHKSKQQTLDYIDADPKRGRMILKNIYGDF